MAHTFHWPKEDIFHPVGSAVPICLTQDIPPEDSVNVLLLESGDPRSILFTVYASGADSTTMSRGLDFTCCETEPALLARNILLFSLIIDDETSSEQMWNVFYDFFLKKADADLLSMQSRKLFGLSEDVHTWSSSKYGAILKLCTRHTLAELRRHWLLYAGFETLPSTKKDQIRESFTSAMTFASGKEKGAVAISLLRAAGPLSLKASVVSEHNSHFWRTGIHSVNENDLAGAKFLNPLFVYSARGEEYNVSFNGNPLATFPLSPAFAELKDSTRIKGTEASVLSAILHAQALFAEWCNAFKVTVQNSPFKLVVRFFVGDTLSFCRALHYCSSTSSTSSPMFTCDWKDTLLELDSGDYDADAPSRAPLTFNVIDTSNLPDQLGLLNILMVTIPLLTRKASSAILTETKLTIGPDAPKGFLDQVCGDLTLMSLLLDLTPSTFLSKYSTYSSGHEVLLHGKFGRRVTEFQERTSWKILSLSDAHYQAKGAGLRLPVSFDAKALGTFLFDVYLKMFDDENLQKLQKMSPAEKDTPALARYVRLSFIIFLRLVKERARTDWDDVMHYLWQRLTKDMILIYGPSFTFEFQTQLHFLNVHPMTVAGSNKHSSTVNTRLSSWKEVPLVVCVTLVVPRDSLRKLEGLDPLQTGTPMLQCELRPGDTSFYFASVHAAFGTLTSTGSNDDTVLSLDEDGAGWSGSSPLVVSFWVPSYKLMEDPKEAIHIGFVVRATVFSVRRLQGPLGRELSFFEASMADENVVHISLERPNYPGELQKVRTISYKQPEATDDVAVIVTLDSDNRLISTFTGKLEIVDEAQRRVLLDVASVTHQQVSPCGIKVTFGYTEHTVFFPFPVDGTKVELRIARANHYIEVVAPPSGPLTSGGFFVDPFPMMFTGQTPTLWNMHRVNLDRLPAVDTTNPAKLDWLILHLTMGPSNRERRSMGPPRSLHPSIQQTAIDLKESIFAFYMRNTGLQGEPRGAFPVLGLKNEARPGMLTGVYTLFFVADLRLDLAANTVVLDAYALPVTPRTEARVYAFLRRWTAHTLLAEVLTRGDAEMRVWKHLLPALAERARTRWQHTGACEYIQAGRVPLSVVQEANPLCSCGQGKDSAAFRRAHATAADLAPLVTRVALSPLFAVSYLETVTGNLDPGFTYDPTAVASRGVPFVSAASTALVTPSHVPAPAAPTLCSVCRSAGKPRLLMCGRCTKMPCCSSKCQKADWKQHKRSCGKA